MAKTNSTNSTVAVLFEEIAALADNADRMAYAADVDDVESCYELAHKLREALCRIGFIADQGARDLGAREVRGDAVRWLLPPAYHGVAYEAETTENA
ncbi:hypothetical protein CDEF62S_02766 [Castellaniella defragrans]